MLRGFHFHTPVGPPLSIHQLFHITTSSLKAPQFSHTSSSSLSLPISHPLSPFTYYCHTLVMKKFGFGKKGDDGDDPNRGALFGSRKKPASNQQSENPYAAQSGNDPYADNTKYANMTPNQQVRAEPSKSGSAGGLPRGPRDGFRSSSPAASYGAANPSRSYGSSSPAPAPGPSAGGYNAPPSGYGADKYGSGGGYGSNRYDKQPGQDRYGAPSAPNAGSRGPGGYGGFGRANDNEPDPNRDALFSGAQQRQAQRQQAPPTADNSSAAPPNSGGGGGGGGSYSGYGEERELTEEEQQEVEYQSILAEKRQLQQESASSVGRSVQVARQANEVGRATLARLGAQGERLHNTERHLDLASNQNKIAQDRAAELKTLNRSMFAVHVGNPFTSKARQQKADDDIISRHRAEREERETTRKEGFATTQRMETNMRDVSSAGSRARPQTRKKDYGKFNLDDEEGADELEDQIDDGIDELEGQVSMMNMVGRAIGKEVDVQNKQIDRIMNKVSNRLSPCFWSFQFANTWDSRAML